MSSTLFILTLLAALGSGLMAGAFFAFSSFIMKALRALPTSQGIAAMQSINIVVINPWFLGVFLGTGLVCFILGGTVVLDWALLSLRMKGALWLLAGSVLYLGGCIGVTMRCNVPLNDQLAAVSADDPASGELWLTYVEEWTRWNTVRTVASLLAALAFTVVLLR